MITIKETEVKTAEEALSMHYKNINGAPAKKFLDELKTYGEARRPIGLRHCHRSKAYFNVVKTNNGFKVIDEETEY